MIQPSVVCEMKIITTFYYISFIYINILPYNKLLSHFHYINHVISYKIVNYYICKKLHIVKLKLTILNC